MSDWCSQLQLGYFGRLLLPNPWLIAKVLSLKVFCRYYFGRYQFKQAELVSLSCSTGQWICCCDRSYDFSVTMPRCYQRSMYKDFSGVVRSHWKIVKITCLSRIKFLPECLKIMNRNAIVKLFKNNFFSFFEK